MAPMETQLMKMLILKALSYFPRNLPVGVTEFYTWSDRIISLSGNFADTDSMRFALASQLIHLGAQQSCVSDQFFIRSMRKAAANQVASQVFQDIKQKQLAAQQAAAQQVEVTTPPPEVVTSDEQQKTGLP